MHWYEVSERETNNTGTWNPESGDSQATLRLASQAAVDLHFVDDAVARIGRESRHCIPLLQAIQEHFGYLSDGTLARLAEVSDLTPAQIEGVASFYTQFRRRPCGQHMVRICDGTACHVKGAQAVHEAVERHLNLAHGQETDLARQFTLQKVACLGCCTLAPVVQIDNVTYGHLTPQSVAPMFRDFARLMESRAGEKSAPREQGGSAGEVRIGLGSCCLAKGSGRVRDALDEAVAQLGIDVRVKTVGCVGMCHQTPLLEILPAGQEAALYARVQAEDVAAILRRHFAPKGLLRRGRAAIGQRIERLLTDEAPDVERFSIHHRDEPVRDFLACQHHVATEHCGQIDPLDLKEYIARGGFTALRQAAGQTPQQTIETVKRSGLRGRGGAGFATGEKWQIVRNAAGSEKFLICNGDEGDPGAFMDRMLLESYPYRIIEGMLIAAHAVGASKGYFYIRAEYPLAVERIAAAIARLRGHELWQRLQADGLAREFEIFQGAGAFVCGEETALIASMHGQRGMPRLRPPFPAESGLNGRPTLVNNAETFAMLPWIFRHGPDAFAALGTRPDVASAASGDKVQGSRGTKVFALAGKVARGGLVEVSMGMSVRRIVEEIGGGIAGGRQLKAVQIGGPSGGCVPEWLCDTPVDYEALTAAGAIMGSGGLVVLDDTDCMVEMARYFLEFTQDQSCGRCTFCRVGTRRMLDILERICRGHGKAGDLEELERLGTLVQRGSLCGLGRTAPNPVLSTLRHFRAEYELHLQGKCPAGRCRELVHYRVTDKCIGCTRCAQACPADAIAFRPYEQHEIDQAKCTRCDTCRQVCPSDAIVVE